MVQLSTSGVTPNQGMGPPWGAFCQITLTSSYVNWHKLSVWQGHEIMVNFRGKEVKAKDDAAPTYIT